MRGWKIYKYPLPLQWQGKRSPDLKLTDFLAGKKFDNDWDVEIELPMGAEILSAGMQKEELFVWAKVDPAEGRPTEMRKICIRGTGYGLTGGEGRPVGRVTHAPIEFHVFEGK